MIIVKSLDDIPAFSGPLGLTIGSFDGVHLGHVYLLEQMGEKVKTRAVLTFENHPATVLKKTVPSLICTLEHKLNLLEKEGVDLTIVLPFTQETALLSYDQFLNGIRKKYPFTHLFLGSGAAFGKGREGDEFKIKELGKKLGFEAHYISKFEKNHGPVSSGRIRTLIEKGDLQEASALLGRHYSIFTWMTNEEFSLDQLCLLPEGKYPFNAIQGSEVYPAEGAITHKPPNLKIHFLSGKKPKEEFVELVPSKTSDFVTLL